MLRIVVLAVNLHKINLGKICSNLRERTVYFLLISSHARSSYLLRKGLPDTVYVKQQLPRRLIRVNIEKTGDAGHKGPSPDKRNWTLIKAKASLMYPSMDVRAKGIVFVVLCVVLAGRFAGTRTPFHVVVWGLDLPRCDCHIICCVLNERGKRKKWK